jgi:WD40 repeat protein
MRIFPPVFHRRRAILRLSLSWLCIAAPLSAADWEGAKVEQVLLDPSTTASNIAVAYAVSATRGGCRVAKVVGSPLDGFAVRVDGTSGPRWSEIGLGTPVFSEDGSSVAYAARRGIEWRWVVNGVEEPAFPEMTATSFAFSPDGKHHAYLASPSFRRTVLVVDGVARPADPDRKIQPWDAAPLYNLDGSQLAFVEAMREERQVRVNLSGKPGPWHDAIALETSPGFGAYSTNGPFLGITGSQQTPPIFAMTFSPDGKHFAYGAQMAGRWSYVIDGVSTKSAETLGFDFVFTPDGQDYAFLVYDGGRHFLQRPRGQRTPLESLNDWTLHFSPDGKHLVFAGNMNGVTTVWLDGKPVPMDVSVTKTKNQGSIFFSPDSQRLACCIEDANGLRWVVDGKAGPASRQTLSAFSFSADSAHFAYVLPRPESKDTAIVVDGKVRAAYQIVAAGPVFHQDGVLEFLAMKNDVLYRFTVTGY